MTTLAHMLSICGLVWLLLGALGMIYADLLRGVMRFLTHRLPNYQRRLLFLLVTAFSLLMLMELAIYYKQPISVGDVVILVASIFFFILFAYLARLSAGQLRASPLVTFWLDRASASVLRLLSLAILFLSWYSFHLSGQY